MSSELTAGPGRPPVTAAERPAVPFHTVQRAALFLAAAAAFAGTVVGGQIPAPAIAAFGAAWLLGLFVRERPWHGFARAVNAATILGVPAVLLAAGGDRSHLPAAAAEAAIILCANRLLVRRGPADDGMLHLACWLALASGAALTGELGYGVCLLAYAALASVSMMLAELRRGIEEEAAQQAQALLAAPELTSRRLLGYAAALGVFSAAFGALVFPLFPRARLGLFQGPSGGLPVTGISDHVDLTASGTLGDSSRVVLRAELSGDARVARYWRAVTLETFTGRGWIPEARAGTLVSALRSSDRPSSLTGTFDFFPDASRLLPIPEGLASLWSLGPGSILRATLDGDLRLAEARPGARRFRFTANAEGREGSADPERLAQTLQLPELSPEVVTLARTLVPDGASRPDAIAAVERYLAGFTYSRELHATATPLEDFLRRRSGHCELFATAVAVLLRARGIPARYVAGYYATPDGDGVTLRDWDAHAWAEALVPDHGFVLVDATPPDLRGPSLDHTKLWQRVVNLWDAAQLRWLHDVVDFDSRTQEQTAGWLVRHLERSIGSIFLPSRRTKVFMASAAALLLLALGLLRLPRPQAAAIRLERALFHRLARYGVERGASETHEEALARLDLRDPQLARQAGPLLARLAAARFGGRPIGASEARALQARIRRVGAP